MSADPLTDEIPLARPGPRATREEDAVLEVLRSGQLSLGPRVPAFEEAFAARLGARHASAVSSGTAGLHLALRAVGVTDGDEVVTSPFSFVASANVIAYERARPVFADIDPQDAQPRPAGRGRGDHRPHCRAATRPHLRLPGRPPRFRAICAADRRGRVRGARRGARRRRPGRRPRPPGGVRLLRQQAADHRRGRHDHARLRRAQGHDRLRAQPGPRARHGLARPRPARLQLPPLRPRVRDRPRPARAARRHARRPRPRGRLVPRGAGGARHGARASGCRARTRAATAAAGSSTSSSSRTGSSATPPSSRCASSACRASRTCPPST